jgi:spore coat protein A, manganese oxidase
MPTRREFLKGVAIAGAGVGFIGCGGSGSSPVTDTAGLAVRAFPFAQSPTLRKFISPLPGLGASGIPVANANTTVFPSADFYRLAAVQFQQQMHPDLPNPTRLWGYMDQTTGKSAYLGPIIVAQRNRPVIIQMQNKLPATHLLPVDTTLMGADQGALQNRIAVHLHGGLVPWTMDGGPFAWYSPTGLVGANDGSAGASFLNGVTGQPGVAQYYYPNNQSARLMWYHDHAIGLTRLNAYSGLASGYLVSDDVVNALTSSNSPVVPPLAYTIPLIIQEKTFKAISDPWGRPGDLWYPSMYQSNPVASANLQSGGGPGRWDLGAVSDGFSGPGLPPVPSCVPEFFGDTPVINGAAYPYLEVQPRRYRFVLLNASQARFFNLNLFYESSMNAGEPDFTKAGPAFIQIGNEAGLLPAPAVLNFPPRLMPQASDDSVDPAGPKNLLLAPAERADLIIDFSGCRPGDRLILYNDAPAPFPGGDTRNDYFTGNPDQSSNGGAASTKPGQGPNTRTLMEIRIVALQGAADPFNFNTTLTALSNASGLPAAYANSHIPFGETDLINFSTDPNLLALPVQPIIKTLNEDFDGFGRLIQRIGTDQKLYTDSYGRNYEDPPTEVVNAGETQVWDIYNTTGDTHPMHFHLVNVQVIGRATFDSVTPIFTPTSAFTPPDPNERGWKETVRVNPGGVTRVIMKFVAASIPAGAPAIPGLSVTSSPRIQTQFGVTGAEYVWHCHILEHEEHDMMRMLILRS